MGCDVNEKTILVAIARVERAIWSAFGEIRNDVTSVDRLVDERDDFSGI